MIFNTMNGFANNELTALLERTSSTYTNYTTEFIPSSCFQSMTVNATQIGLKKVTFMKCSQIGEAAFQSVQTLEEANFKACELIQDSAFAQDISLTSVYFPKCEFIGDYAFANCSNLMSVEFPECCQIRTYAFFNCGLKNVSFPKCEIINDQAFYGGFQASITFRFPEARLIGMAAFGGAAPKAIVIGHPSASHTIRFSNKSICGVSSAIDFYILYPSVAKIDFDPASLFTKIGNNSITFSIYVPSSLVETYKSATNWVTASNYIFAASEVV